MTESSTTQKNFFLENAEEMTLTGCLNRIFKNVDSLGYSKDVTDKLSDDIRLVSDRFGVSSKSAILLAAIIERNDYNCSDEDLARYMGCTNIEFFNFHDSLTEMEDRGIITVNGGRGKSYSICTETLKAVENDAEFTPMKKEGLTSDELFAMVKHLFSNYRRDVIDYDKLIRELSFLVKKNQQLLFCRKVSEAKIFEDYSLYECGLFSYLCSRYVSCGNQFVPVDVLMNLNEYYYDEARIRDDIAKAKTKLQQNGLVCFGIDNGMADEETLSLSDEVKRSFFDEVNILTHEETVKHKDLISCDTIKEQKLYYNPKEEEQIAGLEKLLEDKNLREVQERLEAEGMPKGFCAVFHGCPGSGKTASLKALAKKTGRDLFWVDLSSIKSKWVGESEQNIKHLFDTYRGLVKASKTAPILAVNEADGLFTKRLTNIERGVDNMYNAITDIVLNEMEKLDGIMIATTNLAGNMMDEKDSAMERRFLYKVEFNMPEESVRAKIWKSKINGISDEDAATLAKRYTFSGGNIENIARKSTVDYVLTGKRPDLDRLVKYCEEENIQKKKENGKKIGFAG